jgi:DNA-binding Lrp family transcriptional regulator
MMQDNNRKYGLSFVAFADVKLPQLIEKKGEGWIRFGEDNDYPDHLLRMFNKSSKHNAIVLGKVNYIVGNGFADAPSPNAEESMDDLLKKTATDVETFGGCYLELHYNALGEVAAVYHVPYNKVRSNKENTQFWIRDNWRDVKYRNTETIRMGYNPARGKEDKVQILFYKEYRPGLETYTYPGYVGALNWIETDIEVSKFHLSTIKNGMFSSKFINFYQGVPSEEEQKEIEKSFKRKFTGSENAGGIVIGFNNDPAKAPTVDDLSNTELDKHFDILNKTIQQEIFAGHQITSPMLFGIRVEGQLGGHSEMMDSYEIFKQTYVNDKQQALERLFTDVFGTEMKITPVEPVGFRLSESALLQIAPKEWLLEKAGIDVSKYPSAVQPQATAQPTEQMVNEAIRGLSGRQYQQLMRIVREYSKGKLTLEAARALMRTGYNLQDEDINVLLGVHEDSEQQFNDDIDEILVAEFSKVGESKDGYSIIKSVPKYKFAEDITILQASVLDLIQKDKRITPEVIAEVLDIDKARVNEIIETLIKTGIISAAITKIGEDVIIEREVKKPLSSLTTERPEITQFKVMYSYEGPQDSRNRAFCAKMMRLNRLYSRSDIEGISRRFGYSVWDRRGGWWTKPSGIHSPSCRHKWVANLVTKKK